MKKRFKLLIAIFVVVLAFAWFWRFINGKSTFNTIYCIPENAILIIETPNVHEAISGITESNAWHQLKKIEQLEELNEQILGIDSLIASSRLASKILGHRKVTISLHNVESKKYDFLYILELGKAANSKAFEALIKSLNIGNIKIYNREFEGEDILEIHDSGSGNTFYAALLKGKLIVSESFNLIENSIKEVTQMNLGRNIEFMEVAEKTREKGVFNAAVQVKYLKPWLDQVSGKKNNYDNLHFNYAAFYFDIIDEQYVFEGYANYPDTLIDKIETYLQAGDIKPAAVKVVPHRVASVSKYSFDDARSLLEINEENEKTLERIEKHLNINVHDHLLSWIKNDIVLVQTKPSNLGRSNEFALVLEAKSKEKAQESMEYIYEQLKKNTPIKVKNIDYKDHEISYISIPSILKALFSKLLRKIEKPYITHIENFVVLSNHPQTLVNFIDDYTEGNTLEKSDNYKSFTQNFARQNVFFTYMDIPVLFNNLKEFLSYSAWSDLQDYKESIVSFSQAGLELDARSELLHFNFITQYTEEIEILNKEYYSAPNIFLSNVLKESDAEQNANIHDNSVELNIAEEPEIEQANIIVADLDASEHVQYFANGNIQLEVELKNGLKHGDYKEYYESGTLKIKGKYKANNRKGTWKYYNEGGELVKEEDF